MTVVGVDGQSAWLYRQNLHIEDEERLNKIMVSTETITLVSDGGLKTYGGFGWVAAVEDEILKT